MHRLLILFVRKKSRILFGHLSERSLVPVVFAHFFFLSHVDDLGLNYPRHLVPLVSGSSAQSACEACAPGKYMLSTQSSECLHCEPGKFSTSGLHLVALGAKGLLYRFKGLKRDCIGS